MLWSFNQIISSYVPDSNQHIHIHAVTGKRREPDPRHGHGCKWQGESGAVPPAAACSSRFSASPGPAVSAFGMPRKQFCKQFGRKGTAGTSKGEGEGEEHPSQRSRHGGAACHPGTHESLIGIWHRIPASFLLPKPGTGTAPTW